MALLHVLVGALQDGLLLQTGHRLLLLHAAQPGLGVLLAAAEVDAALDGNLFILSASPSGLQVIICSLMFSVSENSFTGHLVTLSTYHLHLGIYIYRASTISTQSAVCTDLVVVATPAVTHEVGSCSDQQRAGCQ